MRSTVSLRANMSGEEREERRVDREGLDGASRVCPSGIATKDRDEAESWLPQSSNCAVGQG